MSPSAIQNLPLKKPIISALLGSICRLLAVFLVFRTLAVAVFLTVSFVSIKDEINVITTAKIVEIFDTALKTDGYFSTKL
jgi:hypothetical protein